MLAMHADVAPAKWAQQQIPAVRARDHSEEHVQRPSSSTIQKVAGSLADHRSPVMLV
jgi:hypothetical protein